MARRPPIKRSDHKKNKGKKPDQEDNQPQKKDDDTDTSTEPSTVISKEDIEEKYIEEKAEKDDKDNAKEYGKTPENMIVKVPNKDGNTDMSSLATGTKKTRVAENGKLTVIQKSKLMNWAEEQFLRANKIMTFEEATKDVRLHAAASKAMELEEGDWVIVGTEAIKKLRSAMSDRLCIHRKVVKGLYMGKKSLVWFVFGIRF
jgi:hypothetical protein